MHPIEYGKGELLYEGSRIAPAGGGKHGEYRRTRAGKMYKGAGFHCTLERMAALY
ncbi:MAG: hypothetical protein ACLUD2_04175 [Clostridium sp.]